MKYLTRLNCGASLMKLNRIFRYIEKKNRSMFFKDVARLVSGSFAAKLVLLGTTPFATRMYSPEDYGLLSVYIGIVGVLATIATLRLDFAIPLAQTDADADLLLILSLITLSIFVVVSGYLFAVSSHVLFSLLGQPELKNYQLMIPIGIFLAGLFSTLQMLATRKRKFRLIGTSRVIQALLSSAIILGLGYVGIKPTGLFLGNMLAFGVGSIFLILIALVALNNVRRMENLSLRLKNCFLKYRKYPKFSAPEALLNIAGLQIPIITIAAIDQFISGQLFLAVTLGLLPMALLGSSIGQVYSSRVVKSISDGELLQLTNSTLISTGRIAIPLILIGGCMSPLAVPILFGDEWYLVGTYLLYMMPWLILQVLASPVSMIFHALGKQKHALVLQIFGFIVRVVSVLVASLISPNSAVLVFLLGSAIFYLIYLVTIIKTVRNYSLTFES